MPKRGKDWQELTEGNSMEAPALQSNEQPRRAPAWWTHKEVRAHLRVDHRTLQMAMRQTPPHVRKPWVNFGNAVRPAYRWQASGIEKWWYEVNEWRRSKDVAGSTASAGEIQMDGNDRDLLRTHTRPRRSSGRSSEPLPGVEGGNLVRLARRLTSTQS